MSSLGRKAIIGALLAGLAVPALAQIPLPNSRPKAGVPPAVTSSTPARPPQEMAQQTAPEPATNPFAALLGRTGSTTAIKPEQRALIDRASTYLSSVQVLSGKFIQVGPDGKRTRGEFFIQKPGKVRFEYDEPATIEIVADGQSVIVRDRKLATQDVYPLSQTPLRFLLADRVDLLRDTNLVAVYADDVFITVVVEEKNPIVGTSRLMIMFSATDMQLKQWTVTDPQGYDTTVAVYNLDTTKRPDPSMFRIDYTRYNNSGAPR
jgi:outer membrane lipoprotein-sorting protein